MPQATADVLDRTSSRELLVDLAGVPRGRWGRALEDALRRAVRSGRLRPGAPLPSTRALAADLGVSRGVVVGAYEQLAAEGYLTTRRGAAARVSDLAATGAAALPPGTTPGTTPGTHPAPAGPTGPAPPAPARTAVAGGTAASPVAARSLTRAAAPRRVTR